MWLSVVTASRKYQFFDYLFTLLVLISEKNKKAQLTQGLARNSAATWRIRLKFDNAQFGEIELIAVQGYPRSPTSVLVPIESPCNYATSYNL